MHEEWVVIPRQRGGADRRFSPTISVDRHGTVTFSRDFVHQEGLAKYSRATPFLSRDGRRVAIKFHNDAGDAESRAVLGLSAVRRVKVGTLAKQSPLFASWLRKDPTVRSRIIPERREDGMYVIDLVPSFERRAEQPLAIPAGASGIYQYVRGKEIVYIGRGNLRKRANDHQCEAWDYDAIEYSILNDETEEIEWETFWLDEFRRKNGQWPRYNKIGGVASSREKVA